MTVFESADSIIITFVGFLAKWKRGVMGMMEESFANMKW